MRIGRLHPGDDEGLRYFGLTREVLQREAESLVTRDRWIVRNGRAVVAGANGWRRPDQRFVVQFTEPPSHIEHLSRTIRRHVAMPLICQVPGIETELVARLEAAGFFHTRTEERFAVSFASVARRLRRATIPPGYILLTADRADPDRLFVLDNALRNDVPGCDGWRGDRTWFDDEMAEAPPFDPDGYLVAVNEVTGGYVGLARMWRNDTGPRLGLLGVLPEHRGGLLAAALLKRVVDAAANWGAADFTTEASIHNAAVYRPLMRAGAKSLGKSLELTYP